MERKVKYITFHTKNCAEAYEYRTCSPYNYPKCSKCTVSVRKVICKYKKIITKQCRKNDILKFMKNDLTFPVNSTEYTQVLIKVTEDSTKFFESLSMMSGNNDTLSALRFAFYAIQNNYEIIESLLYNELENICPVHIKTQGKALKYNLINCIGILDEIYFYGIPDKEWMASSAVENLEHYINHLTIICNFIYLIILKKRSTLVKRMLPVIPCRSSNIFICSLCGQPELVCTCFAHLVSTSNSNQDNQHHSSSETVKKVGDTENTPHCSKTTADDGMKGTGYWYRPFQNYNDSQGNSTDTD